MTKMTDGSASSEKSGHRSLNAADTLALGKKTLEAAFCSPTASSPEADNRIHEAFELGRQSLELSRQESLA